MVDAGDSKSPAARRAGSSPALGTTLKTKSFSSFCISEMTHFLMMKCGNISIVPTFAFCLPFVLVGFAWNLLLELQQTAWSFAWRRDSSISKSATGRKQPLQANFAAAL